MNTKSNTKNRANLLYALLTLCKKLRVSNKEIEKAKIVLPLVLMVWIPLTLVVGVGLYYHIRWDYFGITTGINSYYTSRFESSLDSYLWIVGEIGTFGMSLLTLLFIWYLWMWRKVCVAIFY